MCARSCRCLDPFSRLSSFFLSLVCGSCVCPRCPRALVRLSLQEVDVPAEVLRMFPSGRGLRPQLQGALSFRLLVCCCVRARGSRAFALFFCCFPAHPLARLFASATRLRAQCAQCENYDGSVALMQQREAGPVRRHRSRELRSNEIVTSMAGLRTTVAEV